MKIIDVKGLRNTRDIGGYVNVNGEAIIEDKFIRSAELSELSTTDLVSFIDEYNIKTIIDFRTDVELKKKPIPDVKNINIVHLPVLEDVNLGVPRNFKQFCKMFKTIIIKGVPADTFLTNMYMNMAFSDYSAGIYRNFFDILLTNPDGAILFNCTEGKDRTGIASMLLMSSLDFDKSTIISDYMLSKNFCDIKKDIYYRRCKKFFAGKKITNFISGIMATKEMYLNAVYEKIEKDFKTVDAYLKEKIRLTAEEIKKLKDMYLTKFKK